MWQQVLNKWGLYLLSNVLIELVPFNTLHKTGASSDTAHIRVFSPLQGCCPTCWCPIPTGWGCTSTLLQSGWQVKASLHRPYAYTSIRSSFPLRLLLETWNVLLLQLRRKTKLEHVFSFVNYSNWFNTIFHHCIVGSTHTSFVVIMQNPDRTATSPVEGTVHRCTAPGTDLLAFQFFLPPGKRNTYWYEQQH